jgi:hypothetical protein
MSDYTASDEHTHTIYSIEINGKFYVGQTGNYRNRKKQHMKELRANRHYNPHLQSAFNKHGESSVRWQILETCPHSEIDHAERKWVKHYDSYKNGFNRTEGGDRLFGIPVTWNGVSYPSISACAGDLGIDGMTLSWRLEQGYTRDSDLKGRGSKHAKPVTWNNIEYASTIAAARANNVAGRTFKAWIDKGYTCDEDTPESLGRPPKVVYWNGQAYKSPEQAANENGIVLDSMYYYLNQGYSCDTDIKIRGQWSQTRVVWDGVEYESIIACATALGVARSTIRKWLKKAKEQD